MLLKIKDLPVSQFMTAYPISVKSNVPFKTVVDFMSERGLSIAIPNQIRSNLSLNFIKKRYQCIFKHLI